MEIFCLAADFHPLSETLLNEDLGGKTGENMLNQSIQLR